MAAPVGDAASPLWAGGTRSGVGGGKQLSLGQEILAGVCTPRSRGRSVGRSSSPKGGLGDESLVKIWSDQFRLTVGANNSFIYF